MHGVCDQRRKAWIINMFFFFFGFVIISVVDVCDFYGFNESDKKSVIKLNNKQKKAPPYTEREINEKNISDKND